MMETWCGSQITDPGSEYSNLKGDVDEFNSDFSEGIGWISSVSTFLECGRAWTSSYLQLPYVNKPIQLATATSLLQPNEHPAMIGTANTRI